MKLAPIVVVGTTPLLGIGTPLSQVPANVQTVHAQDLEQQHRIKCAFDSQGLFNPGKVFPTLSACVEQGHIHVHGAQLPHPHLPRF